MVIKLSVLISLICLCDHKAVFWTNNVMICYDKTEFMYFWRWKPIWQILDIHLMPLKYNIGNELVCVVFLQPFNHLHSGERITLNMTISPSRRRAENVKHNHAHWGRISLNLYSIYLHLYERLSLITLALEEISLFSWITRYQLSGGTT